MNDCVREMTRAEKAKFIMAILERGGYNMRQWERDYLKSVLQEKVGNGINERGGRMIDEKDLIKDIKECKAMREFNWTTETLISLLESASKVSQWIPVSERLPKEDFTDALTCDKYGNIHVLTHCGSQRYPFGIKPNNHYLFMPIAWQPLPEPYKEVEE